MTLFLVLAGVTGLIVVEIASIGPALVRVVVDTGLPGFVFFFLLHWLSEETLLRVLLRRLMADKSADLATEAVSAGTSGGGRHCGWSWSMRVARCACCVAFFMRKDSNSDWSAGGASGV